MPRPRSSSNVSNELQSSTISRSRKRLIVIPLTRGYQVPEPGAARRAATLIAEML
jgi:hypothetical protein